MEKERWVGERTRRLIWQPRSMIRRTAAETVTCFLLSFTFSFLFFLYSSFFFFSSLAGNSKFSFLFLFTSSNYLSILWYLFGWSSLFFFFVEKEERKPMTVCQALTIEHALEQLNILTSCICSLVNFISAAPEIWKQLVACQMSQCWQRSNAT